MFSLYDKEYNSYIIYNIDIGYISNVVYKFWRILNILI